MKHPSAALRPWAALSPGRPASLGVSAAARRVEKMLAALLLCEQAVLGPSTLHLFWDWFGGLHPQRDIIYADSELYPIARWGTERARSAGVAVRTFPHHDFRGLTEQLKSSHPGRTKRPVLVTDGLCPDCGRPAPLRQYMSLARRFGGLVVIDDTQALGILGASPLPRQPYGRGGGGIVPWSGLGFSPELIVIASLAKGFGVPTAVLAASSAQAARFRARSETRLHCSPPSVAVIHAAERALAVNRLQGERLRRRLVGLVRRFRKSVGALGCATSGGLSPIQNLLVPNGIHAAAVYRDLKRQRICTLLRGAPGGCGRMITFILKADHTREGIQRAISALAIALRNQVARSRETSPRMRLKPNTVHIR